VALLRGARVISPEDIIFLMRKDKVKAHTYETLPQHKSLPFIFMDYWFGYCVCISVTLQSQVEARIRAE